MKAVCRLKKQTSPVLKLASGVSPLLSKNIKLKSHEFLTVPITFFPGKPHCKLFKLGAIKGRIPKWRLEVGS
jgi:hypothetical protein